MYFKALLLLAFALALKAEETTSAAVSGKGNILTELTDCIVSYNATRSEYWNGPRFGPLLEDEQVACVAACLMKICGTLNDDGFLNEKPILSRIAKQIPENSSIPTAVATCAKTKGDNDCHTAVLLYNCLEKEIECPPKTDCVSAVIFEETV